MRPGLALIVSAVILMSIALLFALTMTRIIRGPEVFLINASVGGVLGWFIPSLARKLESKTDA